MFTWGWMSEREREAADSLPVEALRALQELMAAVVFDPWEFARRAGAPGNMPTLPFGEAGQVTFLIRDDERELLVTQVQWAG